VVLGAINYVRNAPAGGEPALTFVTEDEARSTMVTLPPQEMWITDGRPLATELDREGFLLVRHESAVADFDRIQEDPEVDRLYVAETADLLTSLTGAAKVVVLGGGKKRYGERATDKLAPLANAKPARYPHADNTDRSARQLVRGVTAYVDGVDLEGCSRYAMYNLWRAVSPPPQDVPLAVCDARSVAAGDEVTVTAITEEPGTGAIVHDTTGYRHNPDHRWHYFPGMTRDEVLVFKAHDSDPSRAGRVPHSAFDDPSCPPGVPTRASVEMRALALFD
jgi:hypothetical protein